MAFEACEAFWYLRIERVADGKCERGAIQGLVATCAALQPPFTLRPGRAVSDDAFLAGRPRPPVIR